MKNSRSKNSRTNNVVFNEDKLSDELEVLKEYDKAVELIRSLPISLSKKLEIFEGNKIVKKLRKKHGKNIVSQKRINRVNTI